MYDEAGEYDWSPSRLLQVRRIDPNEGSRSEGLSLALGEVRSSPLGCSFGGSTNSGLRQGSRSHLHPSLPDRPQYTSTKY